MHTHNFKKGNCRPLQRSRNTVSVRRCQAAFEDARVSAEFNDLARMVNAETVLEIRQSKLANMGLFATASHSRGEVLMRVPKSSAIVLDYNTGLTMPPARWPRLRSGVSASVEPLPWDILQALALIDGLAGDGGEFWQRYCDVMLPGPEQLTLPMCWEPHRLAQLQHADIANAAAAQQDRLAGLLPELMEPLAPDVPSWLQWAFACVRSRAFRAGPDAFAFVPFLDLANHADAPGSAGPSNGGRKAAETPPANTATADFRFTSAPEAASDNSGRSGGGYFELVALRDISPGEEVTISYAGPEGYTNQRFMAQYGFVPHDGNPADRVKLEVGADLKAAPLSLSRLQDILGDALFLGALGGKDPYLFAALKSLPLEDGGDTADGPSGQNVTRGSAGFAGGDPSVHTARELLRQVELQISEGTTTLEADEELLAGEAGQRLLASDARQAAAVAYRVERKRLLGRTAALLRAYARSGAA